MIVYNYLLLNNRKRFSAQLAVEYAMVIAILVGALLAMQIYLKRSIQGNLRGSADEIGGQFSPHTMQSDIIQRFESNSIVTADPVLMNLVNPVNGEIIPAELSFVYRQTNQLSYIYF